MTVPRPPVIFDHRISSRRISGRSSPKTAGLSPREGDLPALGVDVGESRHAAQNSGLNTEHQGRRLAVRARLRFPLDAE
jgi:hypothetical protein